MCPAGRCTARVHDSTAVMEVALCTARAPWPRGYGLTMRLDSLPSRLLLVLAIASEVAGTLCLRASDGFTRPVPALGVLLGYGISLVFFARSISSGIGLGVAYGTLTGCGLAAAALLSALVFNEPLTLVQILGIVVLAVGVIALIRRRAPVPA